MIRTALATAAGLAVLALTGCSCGKPGASAEARVFETPAWCQFGLVLLRTEDAPHHALLLNHLTVVEVQEGLSGSDVGVGAAQRARKAVVYRYVPGDKELQALGLDAWEAARGTTCDCELQEQAPMEPFVFNVLAAHTLRRNGELVATAGPVVLGVAASPSGKYIAVVSAEGPLGDDRVSAGGRRYHQAFRRHDGASVGQPVELPMSSEDGRPRPCWSPDELYVVYVDGLFSKVCVIATGLANEGELQ